VGWRRADAILDSPDNPEVDKLTQEFLAESLEGLDRMDRCLTELEARPEDAGLIGEIFRVVHTIKGATGFLGYGRVERLAHAGEHLMGAVRSGRVKASTEVVSGLLKVMDGLRGIVQLIARTGREGERSEDADGDLLGLLAGLCGETASIERRATVEVPVAGNGVSPGGVSEKTLRVDVEVLNRMMNLVGELVLTRNQILQSRPDAGGFAELARRLDSVTADLRETVMQARMQPVGQLFGKYPRMVRDLALSCGKSVRLELAGQETGLDKSLLEAIKDPLTHALRNAIDHGIETTAARIVAGKPKHGTIRMTACHRNGSVVIELTDDGAGISLERVRAKAIERSLVTEEQAAAMCEHEVLQMIFLPGFSTAAEVTHLSGRGVGMDVVKSNVERVGGTVEVESHEGLGTVLRLRVPLTLAIVPALVVATCGQSFCIPQAALMELVYVTRSETAGLVERIGDAQLFRLRESLLPLVSLDRLLEIEDKQRLRAAHGFYLAVVETDGCRFGLAVDELMAPEEIVVKPLTCGLREIGLFSGATVLGNGGLAMILDVTALAQRAGVRPTAARRGGRILEVQEEELLPRFLVFEGRMHGRQAERVAVPLGDVERIESVCVGQVEYASGRPLLQYRGALLPLEDASGLLNEVADAVETTEITVLICMRASARGGRERIGMVVRRVVDVASGSMFADEARVFDTGPGNERMALVKERLTVVHGAWAETMQGVA
jgi:two-component system chemotaxis sensor kinase CheA